MFGTNSRIWTHSNVTNRVSKRCSSAERYGGTEAATTYVVLQAPDRAQISPLLPLSRVYSTAYSHSRLASLGKSPSTETPNQQGTSLPVNFFTPPLFALKYLPFLSSKFQRANLSRCWRRISFVTKHHYYSNSWCCNLYDTLGACVWGRWLVQEIALVAPANN